MDTYTSAKMERWLRWLIVGVSLFVMLLFVVTALWRLHYPYELEELEGNVFLSALRVFHGQTVYPRPSMEFMPYMYPPGYYYAAAALGRVMGMTLATTRAVSILSTLGCFGMIVALVRREVRAWLPAIAAAGIYAGCYTICQAWFDLGRLDSFFVLLVLLALYASRWWHPAVAAVVWVLAFQTKQSIVPVAVLVLCANFRERKRTVAGLIVFAAGCLGSVAWLNHVTQGWYSFYVFAVPKANSDIKLRTLAVFWPDDMIRPLALVLLVVVAAALFTQPDWKSKASRLYIAACSLVPVFWFVRAHAGSTANALMPIYALLAVLFGIAVARLLQWLPMLEMQQARVGMLLLLVAVGAQELAGIYNPGDYRPSDGVRASTDSVVEQVKALPGEVYISQHPYYAWLAGKTTQADLVSISDSMRPANAEVREELQRELQGALEQHRFSAILLDEPGAERIDKAAGETAWHGYYNAERRIEGTAVTTRPDWVLQHSDTAAR